MLRRDDRGCARSLLLPGVTLAAALVLVAACHQPESATPLHIYEAVHPLVQAPSIRTSAAAAATASSAAASANTAPAASSNTATAATASFAAVTAAAVTAATASSAAVTAAAVTAAAVTAATATATNSAGALATLNSERARTSGSFSSYFRSYYPPTPLPKPGGDLNDPSTLRRVLPSAAAHGELMLLCIGGHT